MEIDNKSRAFDTTIFVTANNEHQNHLSLIQVRKTSFVYNWYRKAECSRTCFAVNTFVLPNQLSCRTHKSCMAPHKKHP